MVPKTLKIWPYVRVNETADVRNVIAALRRFRAITKTAIVAAKRTRLHLLARITEAAARSDMEIIPGLPLWSWMGRLDDRAGWARLGRDIRRLIKEHDARHFVLDAETLAKRWWRDKLHDVDVLEFSRGLCELPAAPYFWRPGPQMAGAGNQRKVAFLCALASLRRGMSCFTSKWAGRNTAGDPAISWGHDFLSEITESYEWPVAHICCSRTGGKRWWPYGRLPALLSEIGSKVHAVSIFPGRRNFLEASRILPRLLAGGRDITA